MKKNQAKSLPMAKPDVVIANVVTRSAQSLSLAEKRILMYGIQYLKGVNGRVKITAAEYADFYDISPSKIGRASCRERV